MNACTCPSRNASWHWELNARCTAFPELDRRKVNRNSLVCDGQADTWDSLGYTHQRLGQHQEAVTCYQHAIELFRSLGARHNEAGALTSLGSTHHAAGNRQAAYVDCRRGRRRLLRCWRRP